MCIYLLHLDKNKLGHDLTFFTLLALVKKRRDFLKYSGIPLIDFMEGWPYLRCQECWDRAKQRVTLLGVAFMFPLTGVHVTSNCGIVDKN